MEQQREIKTETGAETEPPKSSTSTTTHLCLALALRLDRGSVTCRALSVAAAVCVAHLRG